MIYSDINFNHKTILITGGAGFIGSNLAFYLQDIADILQKELETHLGTEYFPNPYEGYQIHTQADISTSQANLGFEPVFSIEEGIKAYISDIKRLHCTDIS